MTPTGWPSFIFLNSHFVFSTMTCEFIRIESFDLDAVERLRKISFFYLYTIIFLIEFPRSGIATRN